MSFDCLTIKYFSNLLKRCSRAKTRFDSNPGLTSDSIFVIIAPDSRTKVTLVTFLNTRYAKTALRRSFASWVSIGNLSLQEQYSLHIVLATLIQQNDLLGPCDIFRLFDSRAQTKLFVCLDTPKSRFVLFGCLSGIEPESRAPQTPVLTVTP